MKNCFCLSGLVIANDYSKGQQLLKDKNYADNAPFFQNIFEIGRRYKIMNPEKMRSEYGKLVYMLQVFIFRFVSLNHRSVFTKKCRLSFSLIFCSFSHSWFFSFYDWVCWLCSDVIFSIRIQWHLTYKKFSTSNVWRVFELYILCSKKETLWMFFLINTLHLLLKKSLLMEGPLWLNFTFSFSFSLLKIVKIFWWVCVGYRMETQNETRNLSWDKNERKSSRIHQSEVRKWSNLLRRDQIVSLFDLRQSQLSAYQSRCCWQNDQIFDNILLSWYIRRRIFVSNFSVCQTPWNKLFFFWTERFCFVFSHDFDLKRFLLLEVTMEHVWHTVTLDNIITFFNQCYCGVKCHMTCSSFGTSQRRIFLMEVIHIIWQTLGRFFFRHFTLLHCIVLWIWNKLFEEFI